MKWLIFVCVTTDTDINRTATRTIIVSMLHSMLQYRSVCCAGYNGSPPNCQRKNYHINANMI